MNHLKRDGIKWPAPWILREAVRQVPVDGSDAAGAGSRRTDGAETLAAVSAPHFLGLGALPHLFEGTLEDLVRLGAEQEKPTVEDEGGNGVDAGLLRLGR